MRTGRTSFLSICVLFATCSQKPHTLLTYTEEPTPAGDAVAIVVTGVTGQVFHHFIQARKHYLAVWILLSPAYYSNGFL